MKFLSKADFAILSETSALKKRTGIKIFAQDSEKRNKEFVLRQHKKTNKKPYLGFVFTL